MEQEDVSRQIKKIATEKKKQPKIQYIKNLGNAREQRVNLTV